MKYKIDAEILVHAHLLVYNTRPVADAQVGRLNCRQNIFVAGFSYKNGSSLISRRTAIKSGSQREKNETTIKEV
jgi:hypothetical protein